MLTRATPAPPDIETVRKLARVLVIDDHVLPAQKLFERDGYHFERWSEIRNLSQLTDGHYHLILLDIQGVGLVDSPDLQGLGILRHIKQANPAQSVILYSSQPQKLSSREILDMADVVLDKGMTYVEYKENVDRLLIRRVTLGYFISVMNRELGDSAILAPKIVQKAMRAARTGSTTGLRRYLEKCLSDPVQIDRLIKIMTISITTMKLFMS